MPGAFRASRETMFDTGSVGAAAIFAVTIATSLIGLYRDPRVIDRCLFRPYYFLRQRQYATMFTSGFVHADMGHLLFNMVTFYFFAFQLERFLGTPFFITLYAAGLVLSHLCTWQKHRNNPHYASLGASGAISAVLFAYIIYAPFSSLIIFPLPIPIPAWLFALSYLAYTWYAARHPRGRINHDAHLCGALAGVLFVFVTNPGAFARLARMITGG